MWSKARKKPVIVEYREVQPNTELDGFPCELIKTREGEIYGWPDQDYVIRGIKGEIYPIEKDIFEKTYDRLSNDKMEEEK